MDERVQYALRRAIDGLEARAFSKRFKARDERADPAERLILEAEWREDAAAVKILRDHFGVAPITTTEWTEKAYRLQNAERENVERDSVENPKPPGPPDPPPGGPRPRWG